MLTQLVNRPCVIVHTTDSGTLDDFGNPVPLETEVSTVCELQEQRRREHDAEGEVSDDHYLAIFLPDETITTADRVKIDGLSYEVVGTPWVVRSPRTQAAHHIEATLRRTAGALETA